MSFERVDIKGRRYYATPLGLLPSVTTVLKETQAAKDRAGIERWRRKEGAVEADRITAESAARGTRMHEMIEHYMKTGEEGSGPWWKSIASVVRAVDRTRPYSIEQAVCAAAGYAGTYDFLGYCGDDEALLDWKSARKKKRREYVKDHFCQAAAYAGALNLERRAAGLPLIQRARIVVAYEDVPADVFAMDADDLKKAWREFAGRLGMYQARYGKVGVL